MDFLILNYEYIYITNPPIITYMFIIVHWAMTHQGLIVEKRTYCHR